jgi:hypothetical protein
LYINIVPKVRHEYDVEEREEKREMERKELSRKALASGEGRKARPERNMVSLADSNPEGTSTWNGQPNVPMELIHSIYNTMPTMQSMPHPLHSILYKLRASLVSSISHHILHVTPVLICNMLLHLLLCQPLEIVQPIHIPCEIRLPSHDPSFYEERSYSLLLEISGFGVEAGFNDVVANWDVAYDPGIHVGTCSLDEYSLRTLSSH